ncbi:probable protein phosphatase 2C 25 isoform X2 [Cryptomeria japonica]|uniref:probable protein phosphatase 2C 25 isoform X2 n=1 Tax=Cryptomeria japonica TaxID=3369 RepID=UPI0027DA566E|nr:probable protein phosphatase 2C 25 isoform X2 [Cryptomeria japonica]
MFSWLMKVVAACWRPVRQYARMNEDEGGHNDELLWYKDICQHACGEFSFAVVQANALVEDQSQVETGPHGTFVGIYDGHGGPEASRFVSDHLFLHLMRFAREEGRMSDEVLRRSFNATEEGFLAHVTRSWKTKPLIAAVGSCCLVGVIWGEKLFVANVGDSRAVMGSLGRSNKKITAEQLTRDHNASVEEVRQELKALHPDDSRIVVNKHGVWRVKGIIQVSRSIGDVYLKKPEFNLGPVYTRFQLSEPLHRPVLTADPSIYTLTLNPQDKFLIFASDGLWEHLTNQQAVEIVYNYPRAGIARRLVRAALQEAAKKREMRYSDLKKIERGIRRHFHDDISVVVIFLDHELIGKNSNTPPLSVKGGIDVVVPSDFSVLDGLDVNHNLVP